VEIEDNRADSRELEQLKNKIIYSGLREAANLFCFSKLSINFKNLFNDWQRHIS